MRILVTGATSGLGRHLAEQLSRAGHTVLVHGRDPARVAQVAGAGRGYVADLASLAEVRSLAERVRAENDRLDVLVNNAGVGFGAPGAGRRLSRDGHELRFAVNYLAPVLLTRLLLPLLRRSAPARIVNVASLGQAPIDFDDLEMDTGYDGVLAYRRSKLALVAYSFDLAEQLRGEGVTVNSLHPATFMDTAMVHEAGVSPVSTVEQGAAATLRLIVEDVGTGHFFDGTAQARAIPQAYDPQVRRRLREATDRILSSRSLAG
ncbi:MAG: SDR family NAD(P)-dependent oxidoreductase [Micromonosporaceae bacterium]|jgi:NAD(P)-dependent dehydrogenase (short-subunit alcohol dehydrogenase family)|nr:SDR family NAD(P)-dependent oxidoreductase [Micromonosporaceae bacterium]